MQCGALSTPAPAGAPRAPAALHAKPPIAPHGEPRALALRSPARASGALVPSRLPFPHPPNPRAGCICCTVRGDLIRILGKLLRRKNRLDAIMIETTGLANPAPVIQVRPRPPCRPRAACWGRGRRLLLPARWWCMGIAGEGAGVDRGDGRPPLLWEAAPSLTPFPRPPPSRRRRRRRPQTFYVDEEIKEATRLDAVLTVVDAKHCMAHLDEIKPEGVVNEALVQARVRGGF